MNIIFLTLKEFDSIKEQNIYADLLREFLKHGNKITIVSPVQDGRDSYIVKEDNSTILRVKIWKTTSVSNLLKKGLATLKIESLYIRAIKKYLTGDSYDLILYSTPPITLEGVVRYLAKRDNAKTYLLLKDIFPQNAVDLGMMTKSGIKGLLYRYLRRKEKCLYAISDRIGCMSTANVHYIIEHNSQINPDIVEECPNSIEVIDRSVNISIREEIRKKYNIPLDKIVFVYGGNLGKPQDIPFIIDCLRKCKEIEKAFFLIIGDGTEYHRLEEYGHSAELSNFRLMKRLPKADYDNMVGACDVGLLFLDYRFTIPNFPSRILSYMQAKLPVFACVDKSTDVGNIVESGGFGWMCHSNSIEAFYACIQKIERSNLQAMGERAYQYFQEHYTVEEGYAIIMKHFA